MKFIPIPSGSFLMGSREGGDWDERPVHHVRITRPYFLAATEVTNAQYEQFDPEHRKLRGKRGLSKEDDEAVVFVSWHDAVRFCQWLSRGEGHPYRLPTEAEWEYACRAGTTTAFHTGNDLPGEFHKHQRFEWDPKPVSLVVGRTPPNDWGIHDMHGNVEEWCLDWYGPYLAEAQDDPVGYRTGTFRVTRGGSHNTDIEFLRSANRLGTLPEDRHWLIGFRVVMGEMPGTKPLEAPPPPLWARDVDQTTNDWSQGPDTEQPYFEGPRPYVHVPPGSDGPIFSKHNHCPAITWCPNGDLLAVWFSTRTEPGREMGIAASRLRRDRKEWDVASDFFNPPDRNVTGSALFHDGHGTLFHFNGLEAAGGWANLALVLRTSLDNGVTWETGFLNPEHQQRNQVIAGTFMTPDGAIVQACDAVHEGNGGTAIHFSRDGGETWMDPGARTPKPVFEAGGSGGSIAGIHAAVTALNDGSFLGFGRGDTIGGQAPMSVSRDGGKTWTYSASEFPPIGANQRMVLLRLREGPLLFVSFTHDFFLYKRAKQEPPGMEILDAAGKPRRIHGMFAALSFDEGKTWPIKKPVSPGGPPRTLEGIVLTGSFLLDDTHAEPRGYLAATQTPDGVVHLVSSGLHYQFNLAWLQRPIAAA